MLLLLMITAGRMGGREVVRETGGRAEFRAKVLGPWQATPGPGPPAGQVAASHVPATRKVQAEPEGSA